MSFKGKDEPWMSLSVATLIFLSDLFPTWPFGSKVRTTLELKE